MSRIEDMVKARIDARAAEGYAKYGVTMERDDLVTVEWAEHLYEELLDAAVYVQRLILDLRASNEHRD